MNRQFKLLNANIKNVNDIIHYSRFLATLVNNDLITCDLSRPWKLFLRYAHR